MAKFKVLQAYKDKELDKDLEVNEVVDMTVKRAEEVEKKLSDMGYEGSFLERVKEDKK